MEFDALDVSTIHDKVPGRHLLCKQDPAFARNDGIYSQVREGGFGQPGPEFRGTVLKKKLKSNKLQGTIKMYCYKQGFFYC